MTVNAAHISKRLALRGARIALLLAPIALTPMLAACVKTSAQPAPPPPPQVTVANVIELAPANGTATLSYSGTIPGL